MSTFFKPRHAPRQTDAAIFATETTVAPGAAHSVQVFSQWTIGLSLGGRIRYHIGAGSHAAKAGDMVVIRPHTSIAWQVPRGVDKWKMVYSLFHPRPHWLEWLNAFSLVEGCCIMPLPEPLRGRIADGLREVTQVYGRGGASHDDFARLELERVLLMLYTGIQHRHNTTDERVLAAIELLHAHYAEAWNVRRLAATLSISPSRLSHLFNAHLQTSPMAYLERVRLEHAEKLLRFGSSPVNQVARAVGFHDPEYFAIRFKRFCDASPREFRKQCAALPQPDDTMP